MKLNLKIVAASAAVAMMSTGAASAATLTAPDDDAPAKYSLEGLQLAGSAAVPIPRVLIQLSQNLTYQDDLFVSIAGANTATATPPTFDCTDAVQDLFGNPASDGFTTGFVPGGSSGNTWNFRVTDQQGATAGEVCLVSGLTVTADSLATSQAAEVGFVAKRFILNQVIDTGSTDNLAVVSTQFALAVTQPLDATIDVFEDRLWFTSGSQDTLSFNLEVKNELPVYPNTPYVDSTATRITVFGEFYWVDTDGDGACESGEFATRIGEPAELTIFTGTGGSNCSQLVLDVVDPDAAGDNVVDAYNVTFNLPGTIVLSPIDFSMETRFSYVQVAAGFGNASSSKILGEDAGAWGINGAQVYIHYMPYGDNISRIIYVANEGGLLADVEVEWFDDEGNSGRFDAGQVDPMTVTQLSGVINQGLLDDGFDGEGKVAMRLTFTAPDTDITVYSSYKVGDDRANVVNTSEGRLWPYGLGQYWWWNN